MELNKIDLYAPEDGIELQNITKEYRQIIAPYANMALCNFLETLLYISDKLGFQEEERCRNNTQGIAFLKILNINKEDILPEVEVRINKAFAEHFKMLRPIILISKKGSIEGEDLTDETTTNEYEDLTNKIIFLKKLFTILNEIRNLCSHSEGKWMAKKNTSDKYSKREKYIFNCKKLKNSIIQGLYDGGKRILKERFSYSEDDIKSLDRRTLENKIYVENKNFCYRLYTDNKVLSGVGMALIVSLFLKKNQIFRMFDKLNSQFAVQPDTRELNKLEELFSIFRISLPKVKLRSEMPDTAIALDMLNEIHKCPDELFNVISTENQKKFRMSIEDGDESNLLMKRFDDRFSYFVLRYFDEKKKFKDIRFQVALGKYRFKFYNKKCVDNKEERVRILQKELNGFGRLNEIEAYRKEKWDSLIRKFEDIHEDTANENPYITDQKASYVFYQNKVGLFFPTEENAEELKGMDTSDGNYIPRISSDKARCMTPVCWLSTYELPAMVFHNLLGLNTEATIKSCVKNYYKLFNDISEGVLAPTFTKEELASTLLDKYGISLKSIPTNMQDYLLGKSKDLEKAIYERIRSKIQKLRLDTEGKLKDFVKNQSIVENEIFGLTSCTDTELERFLADDIFNLCAENKKNNSIKKYIDVALSNIQKISNNANTEKKQDSLNNGEKIVCDLSKLYKCHPFIRKVVTETKKYYRNDGKPVFETKDIEFNNLHELCSKYKKERTNYFGANKFGKSDYVMIKPGQIASILSRDIVNLVPSNKENTSKPTGMNYSIMQANLATFSSKEKLDDLKRMFESLNFLEGDYKHPFLSKVLDRMPSDVKQLYLFYLEEKINYIEILEKELKQGAEGLEGLSFIIKGNKWIGKDEQFYKVLAKRYLVKEENGIIKQMTIDLPRGLFDKEIREKLKNTHGNNSRIAKALKLNENGQPIANTSLLISIFKEAIRNDNCQSFYEYRRSYKYTDRYHSNDKIAKPFYYTPKELATLLKNNTVQEDVKKKVLRNSAIKDDEVISRKTNRLRNEFESTEKDIRRYKVQDFLLLEMAKDILSDANWSKLKLADIDIDQPSILDRSVDFGYNITSQKGNTKHIIVHNFKIKNLSKIYQLNYDNRMSYLLDLIIDKDIDVDSIRKELEAYDRMQEKVFCSIAEIEEFNENDSSSFSDLIKYITEEYRVIKENQKYNIINIRNNFSHNSYPSKVIWKNNPVPYTEAYANSLRDDAELPHYAEKMLSDFNLIKKELITGLKTIL